MSYVRAHRKCDICQEEMLKGSDVKYAILPKTSFIVRSYLMHEPCDSAFSTELDICDRCWEGMKAFILMHRNERSKK